ncbi:hypothetical protein H6P81_006978 [Aristolochia fimbriata]|uniref:Calponin-homology (CH) domain-containing protein n=1 Tax=Aristolochia fimbriata TaxID=158543 RepID=A0AAV7F062_ARIFI|nr:hypothetical protein H6P81_006978 [Aristolochia fimbriata]
MSVNLPAFPPTNSNSKLLSRIDFHEMQREREPDCPPSPSPDSPLPFYSSSDLLKDISNYKTPKPSFHDASSSSYSYSPCPLYFTASKKAASVSSSGAPRRRASIAPSAKSRAARRLKAFEIEQSQSYRKVQVRREKSIKCLSRSLSAWLNFLFENPRACGCDAAAFTGWTEPPVKGKREKLDGEGVRIGATWRSPKRPRDSSWRGQGVGDVSGFSSLQVSLEEVCSLEDLKERMGAYLSSKSQAEVLTVMNQVTKNIDEGRLRMKPHCPIVTDMGLKEKATTTLLYYNLKWLRIGLYLVLGGDSLLPNDDENLEGDELFLKMIIEKQFFSHSGLARSYIYNKKVEGLYRPGYYEALGKVILKRFLLLVLLLDRAKYESALPIKYGIDGIDGGSPLLFRSQCHIKSSRHLVQEFLLEAMHGEGDLIAHLAIVGYKVTYQQVPLVEYNFTITDLFKDLQDGVRLCRAVQLLQCNTSILSKVVVPSDTQKKCYINCNIAFQYLKQAGVPMVDDDGVLIVADDIINGDKELTLSLLWNLFIHLQVPLIINKTLLAEQISRVQGSNVDYLNINSVSHMDMLLEWTQDICRNYGIKFDNFASLVDGKALCCLICYYSRSELSGKAFFQKALFDEEFAISSATENVLTMHCFTLIQRVAILLGNFPEVLQMSDILEHGRVFNEKTTIILLIFLSQQLIGGKLTDQLNIHKIMGLDYQSPEISPAKVQQTTHTGLHEYRSEEWAAMTIQSHFRGWTERKSYSKIKAATLLLQSYLRGWMARVRYALMVEICREARANELRTKAATRIQSHWQGHAVRKYFLDLKKATVNIQKNLRRAKCWNEFKQYRYAVAIIQAFARGQLARRRLLGSSAIRLSRSHGSSDELQIFLSSVLKLQTWWRRVLLDQRKIKSAIIVQSHWRGWIARQEAKKIRHSVIIIQSHWRGLLRRRDVIRLREAIFKIQVVTHDFNQRRARVQTVNNLLGEPQNPIKQNPVTERQLHSVLKLQRWWRTILLSKSRTKSAVIIQSHFRGWKARLEASKRRYRILIIQSYMKGYLVRKMSREQLKDLRHRVKTSAANVDNSMRLISRLVVALQELLSMKSISNILHTCVTIDVATAHSQKCCETLVDAGAIETLLQLIHSVNRSTPQQEVLKRSLSILRNLVRYPHLAVILLHTHRSVETIFMELLRNKEGYFLAVEIMNKLCSLKDGIEAVQRLHAFLKRFQSLAADLERKATLEKKNSRLTAAARECTDERLRVARELMHLIRRQKNTVSNY